MQTTLWIIQWILSIMMLIIGAMKTFLPVKSLSKFAWTTRGSLGLVRFVGISELLIGAGLILPMKTGIWPILTPMAAAALFVVMLLAIAEHVKHGEMHEIWKNILIAMLAAIVTVGRFACLAY